MAMTDSIVVDASLAVKWMVEENDSDKAEALLADTLSSHRLIYAPPHFLGETINALYQKLRSADPAKHIEQADAIQAMADFLKLPITIITPDDLYQQSFDFAQTRKMVTIYDGVYVVLAHILDLDCWTADKRLVEQLGSSAPWVHLISDYPLPTPTETPEEATQIKQQEQDETSQS
jgi:predicted nucleic acid-binding protein